MKQPVVLYEVGPNQKIDPAVKAIRDKLSNIKHRYPVADVDDIPAALKNIPASEVESVDIVGHGSAGRISVGFSVGGQEVTTDPNGFAAYHVLDTNPKAYGVLQNVPSQILSSSTPLRLLGCSTAQGSGTAIAGTLKEVDGRLLLVTLANLLDCLVLGTTARISEADFGADGFASLHLLRGFCPADSVQVSGGFGQSACWSPPPTPPLPPLPPPMPVEGPSGDEQQDSIARVPLEDGAEVDGRQISAAQMKKIVSGYEAQGVRSAIAQSSLDFKEVIFKLKARPGQYLEVLSRGRRIRWVRGRFATTFEATHSGVALGNSLAGGLLRALGPNAPWWVERPRT